MKQFSRSGNPGGYLTVYLSLCLPVILSLFFTLIEGTRMNAIRMQIEVVTDTALDSVMAEFHRELFRQYDLLMVDVSYGSGTASLEQLERHLEGYMQKNFSSAGSGVNDFTNITLSSLSVSGTRFAADQECAALREQITAYMSGEPLEAQMERILADVEEYNSYDFQLSDWGSRMDRYNRKLKELTADRSAQTEAVPEPLEDAAAAAEEAEAKRQEAEQLAEDHGVEAGQLEDPVTEVRKSLNKPLLRQVLGDQADMVSRAAADTSSLLSGRGIHYGDGAKAVNSHEYSEAGKIQFDLYAFEKCGNYRNQMEKNDLKYQIEYLVSGKGSDEENLNETLKKLMLIRLASNMICLSGDSARQSEIRTWSSAAAVLLAVPEAQSVIQILLMLAWSYTESLQDLKTIMAGGKIPLMKTESQWKTSLVSLFAPDLSTRAESGGSGLNYEEYLHILLFLGDEEEKSLRLMDMMEADIRRTEGNSRFRMDWCLDTFSAEVSAVSASRYEYSLVRQVTYN